MAALWAEIITYFIPVGLWQEERMMAIQRISVDRNIFFKFANRIFACEMNYLRLL